jgi:hypothetical protein
MQGIEIEIEHTDRSRGSVAKARRCLFHPSYFLLFGHYRLVSLAENRWDEVKHGFSIGKDILAEMLTADDIPHWQMNHRGSAFIQHGTIKQKKITWKRWCPNLFQTFLWLGTATPGMRRQMAGDKGDKGKKASVKGKGDKGKWKGDKGKCKW